ncbi:NAD(P)-binding protein [Xylaria bambusicola]|uniref:NAD(P)-binding protein n=1 Tax=Xylaria bambusicola TaxID=326684 RepID=UPI002007E760|nr:NAD(P)-binding protein [Xylaria bambusicola]KAI0526485.1 NAD(P)-binding protein [Xylaria bambusicola]
MATPTTTKKLTWLITGCSSGLGLTLVRIAQAGGHKVIATSRNPSATPELVKEVESKGGRWLQLDVNNASSGSIIDELERAGEQIDVLINNAGFSMFAPIEATSEDEIRAHMETMYFGPLRLIRAVLPYQRLRRSGVIANFSSGAALEAQASMGAYAGAKGGLDAVSKVLAKEVEPFGIRVLTILLGTFNTGMLDVCILGKAPLPDEYKDTLVGQFIDIMRTGKLVPNGDKDKAMKAVYQLVVGEGFGVGKEKEKFMPLGPDMTTRMTIVQDQLAHAKEVFGEITNGVGIEK